MAQRNWRIEELEKLRTRSREEPDSLPQKKESPDTKLWNSYGIRPGYPLSMKIELLTQLYQLTPDEIGEVLEMRPVEVVRELEILEQKWLELGRGLSSQERLLARGKMIAEYERLLQTIDNQTLQEGDPRLLTLKVQVLEKLAKLKGIDSIPQESSITDMDQRQSFQKKLQGLSPDKLRGLMRRLTPSSS